MYDHRGFGQSGGRKGHVDHFDDYLEDLEIIINLAKKKAPTLPIILFGHSMGGIIAMKYILANQEGVSGAIFSSPALKPILEVAWWKKLIAPIASVFLPWFSLPSGIHTEELTDDPLIIRSVSARWYTEFEKARKECLFRIKEIKLPFLIFHAKDDYLVDPQGSQEFYTQASSKDKTIKLFDTDAHQTFNDVEKIKKEAAENIIDWIENHLKTLS